MSDAITIPPPDEIRKRIESCRDETRELQRLLRLSLTAHRAERARQQREAHRPSREAVHA